MTNNKQSGFSLLEVVLVVVVVAALAFVGWWFYQMQSDSAQNTQDVSRQSDVPEVSSSSDLEDAEEYLTNTDLDKEFDTSEMDAALQ